MIEVLQWFDSKERFGALLLVMILVFWGLTSVVEALRGKD